MTKTNETMTRIWNHIVFFVILQLEPKEYSSKNKQQYGQIHQTRNAEHERYG